MFLRKKTKQCIPIFSDPLGASPIARHLNQTSSIASRENGGKYMNVLSIIQHLYRFSYVQLYKVH